MSEELVTRPAPAERALDYNLRILWPLARYLEDNLGAEVLSEVARSAGLEAALFDGKTQWVAADAFEAVLAAARLRLSSDDEYQRACVHRLPEAYGPLRYLLWATSPGAVFAQSAKQYHLVSTCGELSIEHGRTWARGQFRSRVPYSRLNCMLRLAQAAALPTLWGLPAAHLREHACVARGDPACELEAHWYTTRRWLPIVSVAAVFSLVGFLFVHLGLGSVPTPVLMALVGASAGYILEERRTERANERTRAEVMKALQDLASEETTARRELLALHERQKEWTRLLEEEVQARTAALQSIVESMTQRRDESESTLLGYSHDLNNPLQVITAGLSFLGERSDGHADAEVVDEMIGAAERMKRVISTLTGVVKARRDLVRLHPTRIVVADLVESLRRRLRALVYGRDIRPTVMTTREVPESIEVDPLALDRIIDNLFTNAAKYTERGSILVDVEGKPGFLVIKVSDTGRGISPEALERVFEPGGSDPNTREGSGLGVGLSVVVRLLEQIGGRLEVMSTPGKGTTFWVELPVRPKQASEPEIVVPTNVVRIRKRSA